MTFGDADASTPGFAAVNTNWATTGATTTAFSPPAGSLVRLWVFADTSAGANPGNETVTDTLAGAAGWTFQGRRSKPDSGSQAGSLALWTKYYASAPGSIQVTVVGNATGASAGGFSTKVVAGCTGVQSVVEGSNTSAVMSIVVTPATAGARCEMAGTDWNVAAAPTAGANQTAVLSSAVGAGPDTRVCVIVQNAVTPVAGTPETCSTGSPSTGNANNFMGLAYTPAAGGGPTPISVADTGSEAEVVGVAATVPFTDAGAVGEALTAAATVVFVDVAASSDALTTAAAVGLAETGAAGQTFTASAALSLGDVGVAGDAFTAAGTVALADTAAAAQTITIAATVGLADTGSAADALVAGIGIASSDAGSAADTLAAAAAAPLPDAASAADALAAIATVVLADVGAAADALSVMVTAAFADSGTATDAIDHAFAVLLADVGSAADILTFTADGAAPAVPATYLRAGSTRPHMQTGATRPYAQAAATRPYIRTG